VFSQPESKNRDEALKLPERSLVCVSQQPDRHAYAKNFSMLSKKALAPPHLLSNFSRRSASHFISLLSYHQFSIHLQKCVFLALSLSLARALFLSLSLSLSLSLPLFYSLISPIHLSFFLSLSRFLVRSLFRFRSFNLSTFVRSFVRVHPRGIRVHGHHQPSHIFIQAVEQESYRISVRYEDHGVKN